MTDETDRNNGTATDERNPDGTFAPGNSGRPRGARHRITRAVEELLEGQSEQITQKAVEMALEGDSTALRLCLERIAPVRKDAPVSFDLPPKGYNGVVKIQFTDTQAGKTEKYDFGLGSSFNYKGCVYTLYGYDLKRKKQRF